MRLVLKAPPAGAMFIALSGLSQHYLLRQKLHESFSVCASFLQEKKLKSISSNSHPTGTTLLEKAISPQIKCIFYFNL